MPWTEVLTCETCPETIPWKPGVARRDTEDTAIVRRWEPDRHGRRVLPDVPARGPFRSQSCFA